MEDTKTATDTTDRREIGNEAAWTLSSAKPGNGVEQLRDDNFETFWQSDGSQPHLINIQFYKKMRIKELHLYCDFKRDESYTPSKISIKAGSGFHDLREVKLEELDEPEGWVTIDLTTKDSNNSHQGSASTYYLRAHVVQVAVLSSHQNGRDTHVRQVKIFGPRQSSTKGFGTELSRFLTQDFVMFSCLR